MFIFGVTSFTPANRHAHKVFTTCSFYPRRSGITNPMLVRIDQRAHKLIMIVYRDFSFLTRRYIQIIFGLAHSFSTTYAPLARIAAISEYPLYSTLELSRGENKPLGARRILSILSFSGCASVLYLLFPRGMYIFTRPGCASRLRQAQLTCTRGTPLYHLPHRYGNVSVKILLHCPVTKTLILSRAVVQFQKNLQKLKFVVPQAYLYKKASSQVSASILTYPVSSELMMVAFVHVGATTSLRSICELKLSN